MNHEAKIAYLKRLRSRISIHASNLNWIGSRTPLLDDLEAEILKLESSNKKLSVKHEKYLTVLEKNVLEFCDGIEDFWAQGA